LLRRWGEGGVYVGGRRRSIDIRRELFGQVQNETVKTFSNLLTRNSPENI
jgi:hypothetical protein